MEKSSVTLKRTENITCDGEKCEKTRDKDSNHWLVGYKRIGLFIVAKSRNEVRSLIEKDMSNCFNDSQCKDFCGEECAIKWVSKQLTEIKK